MRLLSLILLFSAFQLHAQNHEENNRLIDSLQTIINTETHDSLKINAIKEWDNLIYLSDPDLDYELNRQIDSICDLHLKTEVTSEEDLFFLRNKSFALNNMGLYHHDRAELDRAMSFYTQCLKISQFSDNKKMIAGSYNNIGNLFLNQQDTSRALSYYEKGLSIQQEIGDKYGQAFSFQNIGNIYYQNKKLDKALNYSLQSLNISEEMDDLRGQSASLINIANIYADSDAHRSALDCFSTALEIQEDIGDSYAKAHTLNGMGIEYYEIGIYDSALTSSSSALEIAESIGATLVMRDASETLWKIYKVKNNFKKSLEMHEMYTRYQDSLRSQRNIQGVLRTEYEYQYEIKSIADSIEYEMSKRISDLEIKQRDEVIASKKTGQYFLFGGLFLVLLLAGVLFSRFKVISEQKGVIEYAHRVLETKNTEIMDSIAYAKRIQSAVLPSSQLINKLLPNSFVLYKPKDIVAGDFYWLEESDGKILFAACDCTGHGVPGAMVSVFCSNGLNRSVREYGLTNPGEILDNTREILIREFEKSEDNVNDGMDLALVSLEKGADNKTEVLYAGAYNPLWIIRKNGTDIEEYKGDKQPIGKFRNASQFTTKKTYVKPGDTIYLFTDGYADQFGGNKNKKFKTVNLARLLVSIQNKEMSEQRQILDRRFQEWKGTFEQIDDICIIGLRIT